MKTITKAVATGAMVTALAIPIGWGVMPAASQPDPTPTTIAAPGPAAPTTDAPATDRRTERRAARRAERLQRLADELGVTTDDLKAARLRVLQHELDDRVASGRMTQERADEILDAARNGTLRELRERLRSER